jgi:hypothetical protein
VDPSGVALLKKLAARDSGAPREALRSFLPDLSEKDFDAVVHRLVRRELIEDSAAGFRFQVELIRRWFAQAATSAAASAG